MKKGFTLVELLIVMVITMIVGAGLYFVYTSLLRQTIEKTSAAKHEQDINAFSYQLKKDLASIGFGIDRSRLVLTGNGVISCNSLASFANSNSVLARCVNNDRQEELYFLSLTSRQHRYSGCWWSTNNSGQLMSISTNYMLDDCPSNLPTSDYCLALRYDKTCFETNCQLRPCSNYAAQPNLLIFFTGNVSYPSGFAVRYYTSDTNLPKGCAPSTFNLLKDVNGDATGQPVISCVGAFRVRYLEGNTYRTDVSSIQNLRAVRICLLVQVGEKTSQMADVPQFSANCGGALSNLPQDWRWYRWAVLEEDIILENIK